MRLIDIWPMETRETQVNAHTSRIFIDIVSKISKRGAANDKFRVYDDPLIQRWVIGVVEEVDETPGGGLADFVIRVVDGGYLRFHQLADGVVVEADNGDVAGDAETQLFKGLDADGGAEVVGKKDGVRAGAHADNVFGH